MSERDNIIAEMREYFEQRADAEYFTDSAGPVPNEEMRMLARLDELEAVKSQGVPEGQIVDCPYACGWQNIQSIITRNAAYFARETIDDDFPEEIRQSGIASGQYALELCRFARRLSAPARPRLTRLSRTFCGTTTMEKTPAKTAQE